MTKQEFLSASLPYGLEFYHFDDERESEHICLMSEYREDEFTISDSEYEYYLSLEDLNPIVRPFSDLTKPITQADYNNGKEFVPIRELETQFPAFSFNLLDDKGKDVLGLFNIDNDTDMTICDIIPIFQLLLKWHFDLITEDCEKVYVTDKCNPYK